MDDPSTTSPDAPKTVPELPVQPVEPEITSVDADAFEGLQSWLVRDAERARVAAGLFAMLGVALLRRLWQVGRAHTQLALFALCAFAAGGVLLALSSRLSRGADSAISVSRTTGRDLSHAMATFRALHEVFRVLRAALLAVVALIAVGAWVALRR